MSEYSFFYRQLLREGIIPKHCAEVGVHYPETSNILGFIESGIKTDLVEPDPYCAQKIKESFEGYSNVTLYEVAIYNEKKALKLYRFKASTFVSELSNSPALINDHYIPAETDAFIAKGIPFSEIDDGTIDLLSIDTEGCEWQVLQTLYSRPNIISLETHSKGQYKNPNLKKIKEWMQANHYKLWYKDHGDSVYIKNTLYPSLLSFYRWPLECGRLFLIKVINKIRKLMTKKSGFDTQ